MMNFPCMIEAKKLSQRDSRKQCIRNTDAKSPHFSASGNEGFLLVEALPQSPQNTGSCSGNAGKSQRLRDFANR